jgi:hypothetical protein
MGNPFLDRQAAVSRTIGRTGRIAEKRLAKDIKARLTPASGASSAKGDMVIGEVLVEHKSTINNSMSVKLEWLIKIEGEALATGKTPALVVDFVTPAGQPRNGGRWVMVPERVFKEWVA